MSRTMKAGMLRLAVIAMALVMLLGVLPAGVFAADNTTVAIKPVADTYVSYANHTTNYGTADTLLVDGSVTDEKIAFLSYESWPFSGVEDATLNLPMTVSKAGNVSVYLIDDYLIDEDKLNWANMPSLKSAKKLTTAAADGALTVDLSGETFEGNYFTIVIRADQPNRVYEENFNDVPLQGTTVVTSQSGTTYAVLFRGEEKQETLDEQIYSDKLLAIQRGSGSSFITGTYNATEKKEDTTLGHSMKIKNGLEMVLYNSLKSEPMNDADVSRTFKVYFRAYADVITNEGKYGVYLKGATTDVGTKNWKASPVITTVNQWTALNGTVTFKSDKSEITAQMGMIDLNYSGSTPESYNYVDDIFVVETTSGKTWNTVSASIGAKDATVSYVGTPNITAFRPVSQTYVSSSAPDTAFGATELTSLKIGNGNIAFVTFDVSKYRDCKSLELVLPVNGEATVSLMDYKVEKDTFTYNDYKALTVKKTNVGTVKAPNVKIDLATFVSTMTGDYLTVVLDSPDYYEQDFEDITGVTHQGQDKVKCIANADGTITNWGSNFIHYDEADGKILFRTGNEGGSMASVALKTESNGDLTNNFLQLVAHSTKDTEVKLHNLLGRRQMTAEDLGKTYRITFDVKSNQNANGLTFQIKSPDNVYASDGTTKLRTRTSSMLNVGTISVGQADTWETYTADVTLTETMVKYQGIAAFAFKTGCNFFIDNIRVTLVGGEFVLDVDEAAVLHEHEYDKKVMNTDTYASMGANDIALYYYSCACGALGTETFEGGSHIHASNAAATATTPELCAACGAMIAPPTDPTITTRYKIGDAAEWTYSTFAAAMKAASGKVATVELLADTTVSSLISLNGGTISISSIAYAGEEGKAFEVSRADSFASESLFSIYGGAKVTINNVVFNGKGIQVTKTETDGGGIFRLSGSGTVLDATNVKLLNSNLKNTIKSYGGAVYVKLGAVFNLTNGEIRNSTAQRGPAVFVHNTGSTFNMTDSLIEGCYNNGSTGHGAAIALYGNGTFNMDGGLIINNTSTREDMPNSYFAERAGIYVDGAVGVSSAGNKVTLSGNAIIRSNTAKKISDDGKGTRVNVYDAGVVGFHKGEFTSSNITVSSDFTGSVAYGHYTYVDDNVKIATPAGEWESSDAILSGFIDNHYVSIDDPRAIRVGKLVDGKIVWVKAEAEVDFDGKISRYATFADAYAAVGNKAPIKLLADAKIGADILKGMGDQIKVITNGYKVTFADGIVCGTPVTATEKVGAFTLCGYTYDGYDAEVTTYTADYIPHEHSSSTEATATAGEICDVRGCGALLAYPTDEALNTRYSVDGGATWAYAAFANAMSAVNGKTAIVEFFRDVTVTAGATISSGDVIIRSVPAEKNLVESDKICTLTRDSNFTNASMFSISGGATVVLEDVVLDGNEIMLDNIHGPLINIQGANTVVTMNDGVTLMDSWTRKNGETNLGFGGAVYIASGATFNMNGGMITGCKAKNGGAVYIGNNSNVVSTFNMSGGMITGCQAPTGWDQAGAVLLAYGARFNMSGGMIVDNISERNNIQENAADGSGTKKGDMVDGAVNFLGDYNNHMTISGDAIIRNNGGYRNVDNKLVWSDDNADVTFFRGVCSGEATKYLTIKSDFTGSVGIAWPYSVASTAAESVIIAGLDGSLKNGTILNGIIDNNSDNRVAVVKDGKLYWKDAVAQLDVDGKITRYTAFDDAYALVGNTAPIELLANATVTLEALGDFVKVVENGYVLKVVTGGGYQKSEAVKELVGAFKNGSFEFPGVEMDVVTVTAVEGGSIANVSGVVGTDLSLRFYAYLSGVYADSVLRVTRNDVTVDLTAEYSEELGQYYFTYTNIAPQCIGDLVSAQLVYEGEVLDTMSNYSLLQYVETLMGMTDKQLGIDTAKGKELRTLLCDLLAYSAAAQKYTDYNTDALVNEGYTSSEFVPMASSVRKIVVNNTVDGYSFKSAGLRFANVNNLYFKFTTPDIANTKLVVNGEEKTEFTQSGTSYVYFTEDLYATDFDKVFIVELYAGDTLVQTLTYSVSAYVYSMLDHADDEVKELAMATYNYGVAARIYTDRMTANTYTPASIQSGAVLLGDASIDGTALNLDKIAAGIEFAIRCKGNIKLNITAEANARFEIAVDRTNKIEHYLVSTGTKDYELPFELYDGMHTVRIAMETGALKINSITFVGYLAAIDAKDLYIEFVGDELLAGRYMYLNPNEAIDDATAAYAFLAASELGAQYVISPTSKYLTNAVANVNAPALVVIDYQEGSGIDYAAIVANLKATYGNDVKILFAAGAMNTPDAATLSALGTSVTLTTDKSGYEAYPSKGASALNGAELAKYIRENYDFFDAEQVALASRDMIVEVEAPKNGYNTFHVYVKTSDPSGDVYTRYNFIYEYSDTRNAYASNTTTNISNFRVKSTDLVRVTSITEDTITYDYIKQVLQTGEISMAIKTINAEGVTASDFTGGYHGDERLTYVKLLADGEEIAIANGTKRVVTCNSVVFDQHVMAYEHGTSTADSYGTDLTTHNQHFVITRESGVNNRQNLEWQKNIQILPGSTYLQMFTLNRYVKEGSTEYYDVCDIVETYNKDGVRYGRKYESGTRTTAYSILSSTTNRAVKYGATAGDVSATASYDICNVGTFADNRMTNNSHSISVRTQGDNKLYVSFKSLDGNDKVVDGEKWMIDVAYNIDYVTP